MPIIQPAPPRNVSVLIFPDVEILDFCGPFEVFASATLPAATEGDAETRLFAVFTVAERPEIVACRGSLLVQPNHTLDDRRYRNRFQNSPMWSSPQAVCHRMKGKRQSDVEERRPARQRCRARISGSNG